MNKPSPTKPRGGRKAVNVSICMEVPLLARSRRRAKSLRQSHSAYVATLIDRDLKEAELPQS